MKKENIYAKAEEKYVKTTVLYANSAKKLYYDKEAKVDAVKNAELLDLFQKGCTIFMTNVYYKPDCLKNNQLVCRDETATVVQFTAA